MEEHVIQITIRLRVEIQPVVAGQEHGGIPVTAQLVRAMATEQAGGNPVPKFRSPVAYAPGEHKWGLLSCNRRRKHRKLRELTMEEYLELREQGHGRLMQP